MKQMEEFINDLGEFSIFLSDRQREQIFVYYEMLEEWNHVMNLTSITDFRDVMKKHFLDSLSLIKVCDPAGRLNVIDVGTGAGFPGLALKIVWPDLKVTLLDSLNKRIQFLNAVIEKLNLTDVETIHGRAEDFAKPQMLREKYDLCVSRAVANLSTLSEYCLPFVKKGGLFVAYKSEKIFDEVKAAGKAIELLGGRIKHQEEFMLPNSDLYRTLLVVEKVKDTPAKFPRKAGLPSKEPI